MWEACRRMTLEEIRQAVIEDRLKAYGGCVQGTASSLGITRSTLYRSVSKVDLEKTRGVISGEKETEDQRFEQTKQLLKGGA